MIGEAIGEGVQARKQLKAAKDAVKDAKKDRERGLYIAQNQDYTPEYVSDHIGPYQKAESPMADAFLQSFLAGDNAAGIQGTRRGAPQMQQAAQARSAQRFGSVDDLLARERQIQQATPWEVKPFTRDIGVQPDTSEKAAFADTVGGLTKEEVKLLQDAGFKFNDKGEFRTNKSGKDAKKLMKDAGVSPDSEEGRALMGRVSSMLSRGMTMDQIKDYLKKAK